MTRTILRGVFTLVGCLMVVAAQADETDREADRAAIRKATQGFIEAFEKGDAKQVAAHLTAGAELIPDEKHGVRGREATQKACAEHIARHPTSSLLVVRRIAIWLPMNSRIHSRSLTPRSNSRQRMRRTSISIQWLSSLEAAVDHPDVGAWSA